MKRICRLQALLGCLMLSTVFMPSLTAQENWQVVRARAIDFRSKVYNIAVDANNVKWISTDKGLFEIKANDIGAPVQIPSGEQALYAFRGGNSELRWDRETLQKQLGGILSAENTITAATYDARRDILWIGTSESGAFSLKTKPALQLLSKFNTSTTKLGSNKINCIFLDAKGQTWIGTDGGVLFGAEGRWNVEQKFFSIQSIIQEGSNIWVLADNLLWKVGADNKWIPADTPDGAIEGQALALAAGADGKIWVASERIAVFTPEQDDLKTFGPAEYYTSQFPSWITVDLDGAVWVGTSDKGAYVIEKASSWTLNIAVQKDLDCNNDLSTATIEAKVSGGTPPFSFAWKNGEKTALLQNLGPGTYEVTATDSKGKSRTASATLTDRRVKAEVAMINPQSSDNALDGSAEVRISGGTPPYSIRWDNGETVPKATRLGKGDHYVDILDSKGCKAQGKVEISQKPAELKLVLVSKKDISCQGAKDGSLQLQAGGGVAPYSFTWSTPSINGSSAADLVAGTYSVTLTDSQNQKSTGTFVLEAPRALSVSASVEAPASTNGKDGIAVVQIEGGTPPYSVQWPNGSKELRVSGLPAGKYAVQITDARGCKGSAVAEISEIILPLSVRISQTAEIRCAGAAGAALETTVTGGKGPFTYAWDNPAAQGNAPKDLKAGVYQLQVRDASGKSASATFTVREPAALSAEASVTAPASTNSKDGKATATASGGTAPYTYRWDNGETGKEAVQLAPGKRSVTITDANNCTTTAAVEILENILPLSVRISQTAEIRCAGSAGAALETAVSGGKGPFTYAWDNPAAQGNAPKDLKAGVYQLQVRDASGKSASATFTVREPAALSAEASVTAPASTNGKDGKATATAAGGTAPYSYRWDNGETNKEAVQLAPGKRSVTITDANNCTTTAAVEILENILPLAVRISQTAEIRCAGSAGAALETAVSGGKGPFTYTWDNPAAQGNAPKDLKAAVYQLQVSDASGKSASATFTVREPATLSVQVSVTAPASTNSKDGKATATAAGGTAPYAYRWDNGETDKNAVQLAPGQRYVTVTDANNCSINTSISITENILPLRVAIRETRKISCAGAADATLTATIEGGKKPFVIKWSQGSEGEQVTALGQGSFQVTVTDIAGNSATASISLSAPAPIAITWVSVAGAGAQADGQASVKASGGSGTLKYAWDSGETGPEAKALAAGKRIVTVSDENGCSATAEKEIPRRLIEPLVAGKLSPGQTIPLEQVRFEVDSTNFNERSLPMLSELFGFLVENPTITVEIGGHTSNLCSDVFCDQLSAARAKSVADYLVRKGLDPSRVSSKGYGKRFPIATNDTAEGRTKNQRVEVKIMTLGGGNG